MALDQPPVAADVGGHLVRVRVRVRVRRVTVRVRVSGGCRRAPG